MAEHKRRLEQIKKERAERQTREAGGHNGDRDRDRDRERDRDRRDRDRDRRDSHRRSRGRSGRRRYWGILSQFN